MTTQENTVMEKLANPPQEQPIALHVRLLKFLFGHVGMFLLVSFVAAFGAWLFVKIETPHEDQKFLLRRTKIQDMMDGQQYFTSYWWHYASKENLTFEEWNKKIRGHLDIIESFVLDMVNNHGYDGTKDKWSYEWDFSNALLFTVSIMTTIGYGHIAPKTTEGQMFTILYAMIGTPLLLVFLANIGDGMGKVFTYTYSRFCCRWCRSTRYKQQQRPGQRAKRVSEDMVGREEYMPTDQVNVPITINLMMIALYLGMGALIFSRWEEWTVPAAYYFSFITLSTVGFGDMVPGNSFLDKTNDDSLIRAVKMGITIAYCLIGMALISMCIQMMQEQTIAKVRWMGQELGIMESRDRPARLVMRRSTRRDAVPETSYLSDGHRSAAGTAQRRRRRRPAGSASPRRSRSPSPSPRHSPQPEPSPRPGRSPSPRRSPEPEPSPRPRRSPSPRRLESPPAAHPARSEPGPALDSDDDLFNLA